GPAPSYARRGGPPIADGLLGESYRRAKASGAEGPASEGPVSEGSASEGPVEAALATTPEAVATAIELGLRRRSETVWVPGALRVVMTAVRHMPRPLFRRLPM
ncbi:hypothetical protein ABZ693_03640, partial [Streptomyces laurentii]